MDIIEWAFFLRRRPTNIPQLKPLAKPIERQSLYYDHFCTKYKHKLQILTYASENSKTKIHKFIEANKQLLIAIKNIQGFLEVHLTYKLMYQSMEGLHLIEGRIERYGDVPDKTKFDQTQQRRTPYNIEDAKFALWRIIEKRETRDRFIHSATDRNKSLHEALHLQFAQLVTVLKQENSLLHSGPIWDNQKVDLQKLLADENQLYVQIRKTLSQIINQLIQFARKGFNQKIFQQEVEATDHGNIGVMLIHGNSENFHDMKQIGDYLRAKGCHIYNLRLPGHGRDNQAFYGTTSINEMYRFLVAAFKYFYQYMKHHTNNKDGRFYVIGNSVGSMNAAEIIAYKRNGVYPYQSMVKGFIPIGCALYLYQFGVLSAGITAVTSKIPGMKLKGEKMSDDLDRHLTSKVLPGGMHLANDIQGYRQYKDIPKAARNNDHRIGNMKSTVHNSVAEMGEQLLRLREAVKYIVIPTMPVQGMKDPISHHKSGKYIATHIGENTPEGKRYQIKGYNLFEMPDSMHYPMIEAHRQDLFEKTWEFIKKVEEKNRKYLNPE